MKKFFGVMISFLVLFGGLVAVENTTNAKTSISAQNNKLSSLKSYKQKAQFIFLVERKLKKEGYSSTRVRKLHANQSEREITVEISNSEYNGKQTEDKINKIINYIAEEHKLGSVVVNLTIN